MERVSIGLLREPRIAFTTEVWKTDLSHTKEKGVKMLGNTRILLYPTSGENGVFFVLGLKCHPKLRFFVSDRRGTTASSSITNSSILTTK